MRADGRVLRVAIVGAGPAGFYTAEHLQKRVSDGVAIDMFDRLATPYGLVRGGVAPDHQKIKSVTKVYERIAADERFRYYGGVELGVHVSVEDLERHYDAVIVSVGASNDRAMGIAGEDLRGSLSATDFVSWYNGHPDAVDLDVDLTVAEAVVVGNGNVAVDVARILLSDPDKLAQTDIADHALAALRASRVRSVTMLGRRGPAQAAFTSKELRELGQIDGACLIVDPDEVEQARHLAGEDEDARRILEALAEVAGRVPQPDERTLRLQFLTSPTALIGDGHVTAVKIVANALVADGSGTLRAVATERQGAIPAGLVLRAVGYRGAPLEGFAFDERRGVIPNDRGRVLDAPDGVPVAGRYVAGWIKRGPQGVIGTNKVDAGETVDMLLEDLAAGRLSKPISPDPLTVDALVRSRVEPVEWSGWQALDAHERALGVAQGRPRVKIVDANRQRAIAFGR